MSKNKTNPQVEEGTMVTDASEDVQNENVVTPVKDERTIFGKIDERIMKRRRAKDEKKAEKEKAKAEKKSDETTDKPSRSEKAKEIGKDVGIGLGIAGAMTAAWLIFNGVELSVSPDPEGCSTEENNNSDTNTDACDDPGAPSEESSSD